MSNFIQVDENNLFLEQKRQLEFIGFKKVSLTERLYHLIILSSNTMNIGVLAYPLVIRQSGLFMFVIFLALAVWVNNVSGKLLILCSQIACSQSFQKLAQQILRRWRMLIKISFIIYSLGVIITCILSTNDFMISIFKNHVQNSYQILKDRDLLFWIMFPCLAVTPFIYWIWDLNLSKTNFICGTIYIFILLLCLVQILITGLHFEFKQIKFFSLKNMFKNFILILFGFNNQQYLINTLVSIQQESTVYAIWLNKVQNLAVSLIYFLMATSCFLLSLQGGKIENSDLLSTIFGRKELTIIGSVCFCATLFIQILNAFQSFWIQVYKRNPKESKLDIEKVLILGTFFSLVAFSSFCVKQHLNFFDMLDMVTIVVSPMNCIYVPIILYMSMTKNKWYFQIVIFVFLVNILALYQL